MSSRAAIVRGLGCAALAAGLSVAVALAVPTAPRLRYESGLLVVATPRWAFTFDTVWRAERAYDLVADPEMRRDEAAAAPGVAAWLRNVLLLRLGVRSLQEIPRKGEGELERLKALGYL